MTSTTPADVTFQALVRRLDGFWDAHGCALWHPHNTEVGAGTMNPATFLRALGPRPWRVGYLEPSVRPDDSRYGENPNRLQTHRQYQVILKPDPGDSQELYLRSLEAVGVDTARHDVRFVEDNWESPALGAWGLGWEVWLDGLEITQFTYFQQVGGLRLDPVSVEITYGLERILMALQGVDHFAQLRYGPGLTFAEAIGPDEYEMSAYYLDEADPERNRQLFELYEAEARHLLARQLPIPAYQYVLKCSHTFNVLDARGAIGVVERARFFKVMRELAHDVAVQWSERAAAQAADQPAPARTEAGAAVAATEVLAGPAPLVVEVGTEELPPADVDTGVAALRDAVVGLLQQARIDHGAVRALGTPRRLAVLLEDVAPRQRPQDKVVRGPAVAVAFDAEGRPTKAALGFARGHGVDVGALQRREAGGREHLFFVGEEPAEPTGAVLAGLLPDALGAVTFAKSMRWGAGEVTFSRPIRWLLALHGDQVVPFRYAGLLAGRRSRGLRRAAHDQFDVPAAGDYVEALERAGVVADPRERRERIWAAAGGLAATVGGRLDEGLRDSLLPEVANLVEAPTALLGRFDERYLQLPAAVLETVMRKHQRYLPVGGQDGALLPHFVAVANGAVDVDAVRAGNEAVLRARYEDAVFFWRQDLDTPLERLRDALSQLTFQAQLGSMLDKSERVERLVGDLADALGLDDRQRQVAARAAHLAKADLTSAMVTEFSSLAGVMGREYARHAGEPEAVATAVFEHVLPRYAGDAVAATPAGVALALADRLDSLVGLFAVGVQPRSDADPFGLRRAALGVVQTLLERRLDLDLRRCVAAAAAVQPVAVPPDTQPQVVDFVVRRLEQVLLDAGHGHDPVRAALAARGARPVAAAAAVDALEEAADTPTYEAALEVHRRASRLSGPAEGAKVDPGLLTEPSERALHEAFEQARRRVDTQPDVPTLLAALDRVADPVEAFFTDVLVMVDDAAVRANRQALLAGIAGLADGIADLGRL